MKVQIAILPNHEQPGMIETLLLGSVDEQPHFGYIDEFFANVQGKGVSIPSGPKRAKHVAQVYLATTPWVEKFAGMASYKGVWPFNHPVFSDLKKKIVTM